MTDNPLPSASSLPLSLQQCIDEACNRFELAWQAGQRPRLEDVLSGRPEPERAIMLQELIALDIAYRRRAGEQPQPEEYRARFPELADWSGALLERTIADTGPGAPPAAAPPSLPCYEILSELGRGAMGVVYKAWQTSLNRVVALKMIRAGDLADSRELARFHTEAEAVARLQHPHIVQIHEAGQHEGRLYIALECVDGSSLGRELSGTPWPARRAAQLVETLARAMHHAHRQGIVHRDLTPNNVLLTHDGQPKITDFGLAKILVGGGPTLTQTGVFMGTPSYTAPEQAAGKTKEVGPAADVYALGAILYECLTGRPPFKAETPQETLRQVESQEPVAPSRLQPKVPRDLSTVCLKCLQKEPRKRYASAEALAEDLGRFLAGLPVRARPMGRTARLWRWCRRNPAVASLLSAVAVLLIAVATVSTLSAVSLKTELTQRKAAEEEARHQRDMAQVNFQKALQAVDDYFTQVSENKLLKSPLPGLQPLRKELLATALKYYREFVQTHRDDPSLRAELARALFRIGAMASRMGIGSKDEGLKALQEACDIWRELVRDNTADWQLEGELANTYTEIGVLQCLSLGQATAGMQALEEGRILFEKLVTEQPNATELQKGLAKNYRYLAMGYRVLDRLAEMGRYQEKCCTVWERLAKTKPEFQMELAGSLADLGYWYNRTGQAPEALECYHRTLEILKPLARTSTDLQTQRELAYCYMLISDAHQWMTGQLDKALEADERAAEIFEKIIRENPALSEIEFAYASDILTDFGCIYIMTGRFDEAIRYMRRAVDTVNRLRHEDPTDANRQMGLILVSAQLAEAHRKAGHAEEAFRLLEHARVSFEELSRAHPNDKLYMSEFTGYFLGQLASSQRDVGHLAEALPVYEQAIERLHKLLQDQPNQPRRRSELAEVYGDLGRMHQERCPCAAAEKAFREALAIWQELARIYPTNSRFARELAATHLGLGALAIATGKSNEGLQALQKATEILEKMPRPGVLDLYTLAGVYAQRSACPVQEQAERRRFADKAMAALRKAVGAGYHYKAVLKRDHNLEPLRSRQDFQTLLAELPNEK
jgi:serine/threonine protein kinase/predicted Zn-dependent protease